MLIFLAVSGLIRLLKGVGLTSENSQSTIPLPLELREIN